MFLHDICIYKDTSAELSFFLILLIMKVLFSILIVITIIAAILALCAWLMFHSASENHYPDIKDL